MTHRPTPLLASPFPAKTRFLRIAPARTLGALMTATALLVCAAPATGFAQTPAAQAPSGILTLESSANAEVPADVVRIDMFYEQEGADPAQLTQQLNQRTDVALQIAKGQDDVKVKTGSFSISPSTDRDGRISAWRGRSELELQSSNFTAASRLAGQLSTTLQVAGVTFSLSPAAQQREETKLVAQAIASFRQQALAAAQGFGYSGFSIREVNVGRSGMLRPARMAFQAMAAAPMSKSAAVPIEAGTTTVTVNVNGSVQMTR
jgi:predicted secreted protein